MSSLKFHLGSLWLFLPGLGLTVFCVYVFYRNLYPLFFWTKATGDITGNELRFVRSNDGNSYQVFEKATFTDDHGRIVEVVARSSAGSESDAVALEKTGKVTIYYDPRDSRRAMIFLWRDYLPLLMFPFALLLMYLGWPMETS